MSIIMFVLTCFDLRLQMVFGIIASIRTIG